MQQLSLYLCMDPQISTTEKEDYVTGTARQVQQEKEGVQER